MKTRKRIAAALCALTFSVSCFGSVSAGAEDIIIGASEEPVLLASEGSVTIDAAAFPDGNFRKYVSANFDKDGDGILSQAECAAVTSIYVPKMSISDLTGIEYFTNLTSLVCDNNRLTSLDVSKNTALDHLSCEYNRITSLDVSQNPKVEVLHCYNNYLSSLNVSGCSELVNLHCDRNSLTSLDVSDSPNLQWLYCSYNKIANLDLSNNSQLLYVYVDFNNLTSLDISNTIAEHLICTNNNISNLKLNNDLTLLHCSGNPVRSLDVSGMTALEELFCSATGLASLDVSNNEYLTKLHCDANSLVSLNLSNNPRLTDLSFTGNQISSIYLNNKPFLEKLYCDDNPITSLDLSNNTALTEVYCNNNQLTSLDLSNNTDLIYLNCSNNQLTSLDLSQNNNLSSLSVSGNSYSVGDIVDSYPLSKLPTGFDPSRASEWTGAEYDSVTNCLFNFTSNEITYKYDLGNGKSTTFMLKANSCKNPNVLMLDEATFPDDTFRQYLLDKVDKDHTGGLSQTELNSVSYIDISGTDYAHNTVADLTGIEHFKNLSALDCSCCALTSLDLSKNTALKLLYCRNNQLESLDLSANTALESLDCKSNRITFLNLTSNTALKELDCRNNQLASLDLSANTALESLHCEENMITILNLTSNTVLKTLGCGYNRLTSLDLSANTALESLDCKASMITILNLTSNTALKTLNCKNNQLAFLDLTANTALETLSCDYNRFSIGDVTDSYSLSKLPSGFDPSKASDWTGAEYDSSTKSLKKFTSKTISYTYDCGNGFSKTFELYADSVYFTPAAPVFTASPFEDRIYLTWNAVSNAVKYKVSYRVKGTDSWTEKETNAKSLDLTGLSAETTYEVIVTACGGQLWSDYTDDDIMTVTTTAAVYPDLPEFTAEPSEFSITVSWSGVSTATGYRVWFREKGASVLKYREVSASSDYSKELTSLTPGKSYEIIVTAYNGKHWSQYTDADIMTVTTVALPKPSFTAVAGDKHSTIVVSWDSVENADNYEINYRISGSSDWSTSWTSGNKVTIDNLKGGSLYEVAVKARINSVWSESDIVTVTPNAPLKVNVTATPGIKAVLLEWEPVEGATNYNVYCRKKGLSAWSSYYTADTKYIVRSLNTDTEYEFLVTAYVDGEWTYCYDDYILTVLTGNASNLKNPEFTIVPSLNRITVSWDSAADAEKYKVCYRKKGYTYWSEEETAETSYTLTGIKSYEEYEFAVSTYIGNTWLEFADEDIKTASSLPMEKPIVTAKAGVNGVTLSWNAVSGAEKYDVYYRKSGETSWHYESCTAETSYTMTGLMSDTAYEFYVQAKSSLEFSGRSNTVTATPKKSILKAQAGLHSVTLTWDAVDGNTNYTVYCHKENDIWKTFETSDTSYTITDLEGGIPIVCKVVPERFQYLDIQTDEVTVTPKAFEKPTVTAVPSETAVTLNWNAVEGATYYNVLKRLSGAYSWDNPIKTSGTSYEFTGLTSGTKYDFAVLPCNDAYSDTWASTDDIVTVKTGSYPPAKPVFTVTPNTNKATLEWQAVNGATSYYLYYRLNGTEEWVSESWGNNNFSRTFYGLAGGEKYDFLVRACNDSLLSEFTDSDIVTVTILSDKSEDPEPDDPISAFVERLYMNILNRPSDPSKVSHIDNLNSGESACKVAYDFVFSSEFANLPISNEERVKRMYLTFLNREADPAGLADWTEVLDNGCSVGHIFYGFTQSDEFTKICNEYGINRGTWEYTENRDRSSKLTAFVSRLYTKAMGRNYDVNGLNDHTGSYLENHDLYQLAYNFIFSQEFIDKNLSDEDFVDVMYRTFFDREADPDGKADWLGRMRSGCSREEVLAGFVGSQECAELVAKFGI